MKPLKLGELIDLLQQHEKEHGPDIEVIVVGAYASVGVVEAIKCHPNRKVVEIISDIMSG